MSHKSNIGVIVRAPLFNDQEIEIASGVEYVFRPSRHVFGLTDAAGPDSAV